jgi:C4-dicarboxylate-specific signal transduction histidine kinase
MMPEGEALKGLRDENRRLNRQIEKLARISDRLQAQHNETMQSFNQKLQTQVQQEVQKRMAIEQAREQEHAFLAQQSKTAELGHMIGGITHQWKQPLNAIGLIAQDLIEEMDAGLLDRALLSERIEEILGQLQFMGQTIDDFHDFYKPSRRQQPFSPAGAIDSLLSLIRIQMINAHIEIETKLLEAVRIEGWPSDFKQVILNLITNAKDTFIERDCAAPRCIKIVQQATEKETTLMLCDNAGGIADHLLPEGLFEPFQSSKEQGSGIGLSISRTLIERIGGTLQAQNRDQGACFIITLPRL